MARMDTIVEAWCGAENEAEAIYNWSRMLIAAADKRRHCHTKKECVAILAQQGIATTTSAINQLSWSGRISHILEKRFHAGMNRKIALFDPKEIARYYERKRK